MSLALLVVAALLAVIEIVRSRGTDLCAWALLAICARVYF